MKKSTFQKNIFLSLAALTTVVSILILIGSAGQISTGFASVLYMAATFSLGTVSILTLMRPVKKLQPIRVKK